LDGRRLTSEEQVTTAQIYIAKIRYILDAANQRIQEAREKNDVILLNCIKERLEKIKETLQQGEQSQKALTATNDLAVRQGKLIKLMTICQTAINLGEEAKECIGETAIRPKLPEASPHHLNRLHPWISQVRTFVQPFLLHVMQMEPLS
jgi:hypothetical protein